MNLDGHVSPEKRKHHEIVFKFVVDGGLTHRNISMLDLVVGIIVF